MRITKMPKKWRHISAILLAVAVVTAMLAAALSGADETRAQAQTQDTPTPVPTAAPSDDGDSDVSNAPAQQGKNNPPQYANMDALLNQLVAQVEQGITTVNAAAAKAPLSDEGSVAVTLHIEADNVGDVQGFLQDVGASARNVGEDYIEAYVPVSLLARTSQQEGVINIMTIVPPQPAQGALIGEGFLVHGAEAWHNAGLRGEGVKV